MFPLYAIYDSKKTDTVNYRSIRIKTIEEASALKSIKMSRKLVHL